MEKVLKIKFSKPKEKFYKITVYYCDNCKNQVSVIEKNTSHFAKGVFQTGINKQGKIGTWCSKKCFKEYKNQLINL